MNLNRLVTIERHTQQQDEAGQIKDVWSPQSQVWARIRPISTREYMNQSGERAEITHEIVIRTGPELRARDRITLGDRTFDVLGAYDINDRERYTKIRATAHG